MRAIIVGLGIQGKKRRTVAGSDVVATVDSQAAADFRDVQAVPLASYDAALVCTPDSAKIPILEYLLRNRKHVLVEKPLVSEDEGELTRLRDLAQENRAVCYTAYNHRFEPHIVRLKEAIDSGRLGRIHYVKLFYGNGTARDVRNSPWRDKGMGIIPDLGSHLLDTIQFWFGDRRTDFEPLEVRCMENQAPDYLLFGTAGKPFILGEATLLSWRNTFHADVIGEFGSAHIFCLCKWGPSVFTLRTRVLPSGRPAEETATVEGPDPTWAAEYEHFKSLCRNPSTNIENDLWINRVFRGLWRDGTEVRR